MLTRYRSAQFMTKISRMKMYGVHPRARRGRVAAGGPLR